MERGRGQGAFEYILMLSGVLLVVVTIVFMMQGTVSSADDTLDAQMKSAGVSLDPSYYTPGAKPQFLPNSPADGAWGTGKPNISALITVKDAALNGLIYNWNGANYSIYDQSLVLAMNFDDANLIGDTASRAVDVSSYGNNGTTYGNTALLLHMDENSSNKAYDESVYKNNGTCVNMAAPTGCNWVTGKAGTAIDFDGTNDYVNLYHPASLTLGINGAIEAWIYPRQFEYATSMIAKSPDAYFKNSSYTISTTDDSFVSGHFVAIISDGTNQAYLSSSGAYPTNNWYHVVNTWDSGSIKLYVNGALAAQGATGGIAPRISSYDVTLGCHGAASGRFFNGSIDEVVFLNRTLSATEALARYNAGHAKHADWDQTGKWGSAMKFDGLDDWVEISSAKDINTSTNAISVEAWLKPMSTHLQGYGGILYNVNGYGNSRILLANYGLLLSQVYIAGSKQNVYGPWVANYTWNHVVYVYNGTHELFYVNGIAGTAYAKTGTLNTGTAKPTIGWGHNTHANYHYNGSIDEVRVWNRALSPAEIEMQYRTSLNKYTPNAWLFNYENESLAVGAYNYTMYTNGGYRKDSASETRTVKVCAVPLVPC